MTQKDRTIVIKLRWTDYDRAGRCAFRVNRKRGTCAEEPQDFASGICTESKTRDRIDDMIDVASNGADLRHLMGGSLPRRSILLKVASGEQFFDPLLQRLREGMLHKTAEWEKGSIGVCDARRFSSRILDQDDSDEFLPGKKE
jgi:hypothetical protein